MTTRTAVAKPNPLTAWRSSAVLAGCCVAPWRAGAGELAGVSSAEPPDVSGFVISRFGPLVLDAARRCLGDPTAEDNRLAGLGAHTAVVLGTVFGDSTSLDVAAEQLATGRLPDPLLCYQAVPTSVLGKLSHDYAITGPITCVSAVADHAGELVATAELLLADEDVHRVVLLAVELSPTARVDRILGGQLPPRDTAVCVLLGRPGEGRAPGADRDAAPAEFGALRTLVQLCVSPGTRSIRAEDDL